MKMKGIPIFLIFLSISCPLQAQTGIGSARPFSPSQTDQDQTTGLKNYLIQNFVANTPSAYYTHIANFADELRLIDIPRIFGLPSIEETVANRTLITTRILEKSGTTIVFNSAFDIMGIDNIIVTSDNLGSTMKIFIKPGYYCAMVVDNGNSKEIQPNPSRMIELPLGSGANTEKMKSTFYILCKSFGGSPSAY